MIALARPTDAEVVATHNDVEMIERPHLWPWRGVLPLTRGPVDYRTAPPEAYAFMLDAPGTVAPFTVFVGLPLLVNPTPKRYPSAAAIVADGWTVD